jgi:hypothetical protein
MTGQLGITNLDHTHVLAPNLILRKVHQKANPQYQQAVDLALSHRLAHQPYFSMGQLVAPVFLGRKTFYGLARSKPLKQSNDLFEGLVLMLEGKGLPVCLFNVRRISGQ